MEVGRDELCTKVQSARSQPRRVDDVMIMSL